MYLSFYLPLYSAEFVSKTHFVYKVAFFLNNFFHKFVTWGSIARYYFKLESSRKLIKKSHTFPTIAFLRYLKEQWEFCKEVFNIMLMSSELVFCVLVIMRRLPPFDQCRAGIFLAWGYCRDLLKTKCIPVWDSLLWLLKYVLDTLT